MCVVFMCVCICVCMHMHMYCKYVCRFSLCVIALFLYPSGTTGDRAIIYEIMDYLEDHPEILKVDSHFDSECHKKHFLTCCPPLLLHSV